MINIASLFNLKGLGGSLAAGILIGGGGAFWLSGAAKAKADKKVALEALGFERDSHMETKALAAQKDLLVENLTAQSQMNQEYINGLQSANIDLAKRLPRDTVRYIERGQELADEIYTQGGDECLRWVPPNELRLFANGQDIDTRVSDTPDF